MTKPVRVTVTGAAGQISYSLLFRIAAGEMLGPNQPVILQMLEITPALEALKGVAMELDDCAFPLLAGIVCTDKAEVAFKDSDYALLVGARPRGPGMERKDLLEANAAIFSAQGKAINEHASRDIKVLVVGNPANTNALIGMNSANNSTQQWFAMTALDANRAKAQLAEKAAAEISSVKNMIIWGNHSPTMYPDPYNATINGASAAEVINDNQWIEDSYLPLVQQRGKAVIDARGASSAASAANAAIDTVKAVINPTKEGDCFSAAVVSDGSYGIPKGLIFGFPLRTNSNGKIEIIQGIELNEFAQTKIKVTTEELESEREAVSDLVG